MDPTEDLSARVLLKHILSTEPPRTPISRSVSQGPGTSGMRRSGRLSNKDAGAQTPQDILRRSLKHKMRESITRKSLPATRRRTGSVVSRKTNTPAAASVLFDDGDTPRHILMNILRTEPVKSPVVHEKVASEEPQPPSALSTITKTHPSIELSGLDLPDLTIGNAASTVKGLSRKRPRRSLNVTAFEKRLKDDADEGTEESIVDHSSLSLSSSTSLSLKTPFVDVRTEKRGLQRRVSNRRKVTEEEFGAAVDKRQIGGVSSFAQVERGFSETAHSEGFTLGLSRLSEPNITADIINCNTALYAQSDAITSNFSIVATQDKPTLMVSQLQGEMEQKEQMEVGQSKLGEDKSMYTFPSQEYMAEPQNDECVSESQSQEEVDGAESQQEEGQPEDAAVMLNYEEDVAESQTGVRGDTAESEEEANRVEAETEEEGAADSQPEEDVEAGSQSEEGEVAPDSETEEEEEEGASNSQSKGDVEVGSQSEKEEIAPDVETEEDEEEEEEEEEEGAADSQPEEDVEVGSQSEDEEVAPDIQSEEDEEEEEEGAADSQPEEDVEAGSQSDEDRNVVESQNEDGYDEKEEEEQALEQLKRDVEYISRRVHRSEGALIMPITDAGQDLVDATAAGWSDAKPKAHSALDLHNSLEMESHESGPPHIRKPELADFLTQTQPKNKSDANKENSFHLPELTQDIEYSGHLNGASPEGAPADVAEQEEEEDEEEEEGEESEEFPCTTPAFVRQKRIFLNSDPPASPSGFKNIQASTSGTSEALPPAKSKVRRRKEGPPKKRTSLPKTYLMNVFKHFAKTKVSADVYPVLNEITEKFLDRLAEDLETYAVHGKRKTIEVEDAVLLLKRQGYVNDKVPVEVLIEKYLRMEQRKTLIPIATSGNVVIPAKQR